jgi:pilus assembly protein CpaE
MPDPNIDFLRADFSALPDRPAGWTGLSPGRAVAMANGPLSGAGPLLEHAPDAKAPAFDAGIARLCQSPAYVGASPSAQRRKFIGFVRDAASALTLQEALCDDLPAFGQVHVTDFRTALAVLSAMPTPETIQIDLSEEDQPINALLDLAEIVEAGTQVLAIGKVHNVSFYRTITKGMGVAEYLSKPLSPAAVERVFLPIVAGRDPTAGEARGGRVVAVAGARGGVGASTVATNLAWYIGNEMHRHTALVDSDLHTGTIALDLDIGASNSLGAALERPERVDPLLIERSMRLAGERLHVLAGQEDLDNLLHIEPHSSDTLFQSLRARYNFVIADAGARYTPLARDLLQSAHHRVVVLDPSIIAVRNLDRLLSLPPGPAQSPRPIVVLSKAAVPGGLAQAYLEELMGMRFTAVIPYLPRLVPSCTQHGAPAAARPGPFRKAIAQLAECLGARRPA